MLELAPKRQNRLGEEHIQKVVSTYQQRGDEHQYSRRVSLEEIADNGYNLNVSRYVSLARGEEEVCLEATHEALVVIDREIRSVAEKHNAFLPELGLPELPEFRLGK